jgi:hypothetical protein
VSILGAGVCLRAEGTDTGLTLQLWSRRTRFFASWTIRHFRSGEFIRLYSEEKIDAEDQHQEDHPTDKISPQ